MDKHNGLLNLKSWAKSYRRENRDLECYKEEQLSSFALYTSLSHAENYSATVRTISTTDKEDLKNVRSHPPIQKKKSRRN